MYNIAAIALDDGGGEGAVCPAATVATGCVLRIAPMMKKQTPIPSAEMNSDGLRPRLSTMRKTNKAVAITLTMPYMPEARREFSVPEYPIYKVFERSRARYRVCFTDVNICGA